MRNDCKSLIPSDYEYRLSPVRSVGDSAKNAFHSNPENTVFDAKRLIGRKFDDNEVQRDMKHWPFKVTSKAGKPNVQVKYRGESREFVSILCSSPGDKGCLNAYLSFLDSRGDLRHGFGQDEGDG